MAVAEWPPSAAVTIMTTAAEAASATEPGPPPILALAVTATVAEATRAADTATVAAVTKEDTGLTGH